MAMTRHRHRVLTLQLLYTRCLKVQKKPRRKVLCNLHPLCFLSILPSRKTSLRCLVDVDGLQRTLLLKTPLREIVQRLSLAVVAGLRSQEIFLPTASLPKILLPKTRIQLYLFARDGLPFQGEALAVLASIL